MLGFKRKLMPLQYYREFAVDHHTVRLPLLLSPPFNRMDEITSERIENDWETCPFLGTCLSQTDAYV